jgi:hypothetical protein
MQWKASDSATLKIISDTVHGLFQKDVEHCIIV